MSNESPNPMLSLPSFTDNDAEDLVAAPRRPWWRRPAFIIIAGLVILVLVGGSVFAALRSGSRTTTYQYQKVYQSDFALTVSATGPIQSGVYNVVFSGSGKISEIDVKVGQTVKKGQVLAKLDKTSLQDALDQAQAAAMNAQNSYNDTQNSYDKTQGQTGATVAAAQTTFTNAQSALSKILSQTQASINAAVSTLTNDQASLTNTQASAQASIDSAQTALSNDQTNLNNTQATSQATINSAQTTLNNAQTSLQNAQTQAQAQINLAHTQELNAIAACNPTPAVTPGPSPNCVQLAQQQYQQTVAQANSTVATAQAQVNSAQSALDSAHTQATANNDAAQAKVASDQKALNTAQIQATTNVAVAQAKITSDQKQLAVSQTQGAASNNTAQSQVSSAQSQLTTAQANAAVSQASAQSQLTTAQGQLNTALAQLTTAKHNLQNATLTSPHDGIVATVNGTVGGTPGTSSSSASTTASGGGTFIQIVDDTALQVLASVNESDVGNLKVGEPVQFTVSAYGDRAFRGTVSAISPNGQTVSNVVTYPVTVDVDMTNLHNLNLLPGMTANITITVIQRKSTLLIPVGAINFARTASASTNGQKAIISTQVASSALLQARQMLNELETENPAITADNPIPAYVIERAGDQFVVKPVVLGLTDETTYEVLRGLTADEVIVVGVQRG